MPKEIKHKWLAEIKNPYVHHTNNYKATDCFSGQGWQECMDTVCKAYDDRESRAVELLEEINDYLSEDSRGSGQLGAGLCVTTWRKAVKELLKSNKA